MPDPNNPQPTPIEGTLVWECNECSRLSEEVAGPIFECDEDGVFNVELSNSTNQCPTCKKFAKKVGEQSCAECNEGEVSQVTAITCTCHNEWHKVE